MHLKVMSCRHHEGAAEADKIFIMLWNGNLYSVTGTMLSDEAVTNEALDLKLAVDIKTLARQNSTGGPADDSDSDDDDDFGEYRGFCVYGNRIVIYGNDGLFTAMLKE